MAYKNNLYKIWNRMSSGSYFPPPVKGVRKHTDNPWVLLYIERWLVARLQRADGSQEPRTRGTPQGG